jgi:hypothetical protein
MNAGVDRASNQWQRLQSYAKVSKVFQEAPRSQPASTSSSLSPTVYGWTAQACL